MTDPECASKGEIDDWLRHKKIMFKVIKMNSDFGSFGDSPVSEAESWLSSIPLKPGLYSDTGYRFVKNVFERQDSWIPFM